jgi:hypothetical protein
MPATPFVGVMPHGELGIMEGTSFAAPLATHGLAGLLAGIGEHRASPELLRAFAIHHAQRRPSKHDLNEIGFGRFRERYDNVWVGARNEVTVVYEDALRRDGVAGMLLPVPAGMPDDAAVELWWTLCLTVPVAPKDAVEYTKAGCEILFRPHRHRYSFTVPGTNKRLGEADIRTERDQALQFIRAGGEQSRMPVSKSAPRVLGREQGRREGGKWESVIQQRFSRLAASTLVEPTIELKYMAREGGVLQREVDALPFSLVVTVRTRESVDLYGLATAEFPLLTPIDAEIDIRV